MSVPEASVYEDHRAVLAHNNVGMPRQSRMVQPVPEPVGKEIFAHDKLRLRALAVYGCHTTAALFLCHLVHYGFLFRIKLQVSNEIRQLRNVCIFDVNGNGIDMYKPILDV